jgi:hypothetical protein
MGGAMKEAMKLALEAVKELHRTGDTQVFDMYYAQPVIKALEEALSKQEQGEPVAYLCENAVGHKYFRWKKPSSTYKPIALYTTPQQRTWVGLTPLNIEDKYVRNYLWDRALIAIDDPCCRSHPHENMNEYCQRRTELARHQAKLKEKNT